MEETFELETLEKGIDEAGGFYLIRSGMYFHKEYLKKHVATARKGFLLNLMSACLFLNYINATWIAYTLDDIQAGTESSHVAIIMLGLSIYSLFSRRYTYKISCFLNILGKGFFKYNDTPLEAQDEGKREFMNRHKKIFKYFSDFVEVVAVFFAGSVLYNYVRSDISDYQLENNRVDFPIQTFYPVKVFTMQGFLYGCWAAIAEGFVIGLQFKALNLSLQNIEWRAKMLYKRKFGQEFNNDDYLNNNFQDCMYECLRENIQHHILIKKSFNYLKSTFGYTIQVLMSTSAILLASNAASIYKTGTVDVHVILFALLLTGELIHVFLICWFGETLATESENFSEELYNTPWYRCNTKYRKALQIMMANALTPCTPTETLLKIPANMETFNSIISGAYTYLNLLTNA